MNWELESLYDYFFRAFESVLPSSARTRKMGMTRRDAVPQMSDSNEVTNREAKLRGSPNRRQTSSLCGLDLFVHSRKGKVLGAPSSAT